MSLFQSAITTTRNPDPIPESKLKWHGTAGAYDYAEHRGIEYAVLRSPVLPEEYVVKPGELLVNRKRVEILSGGAEWPVSSTHLALPVPAGTWAEIEQRRQAREARRTGSDRPPRLWSALGDLLGRPSSDPHHVVLGAVSDDPSRGAMQAATGVGGPLMIEVKPRTLEATPAGFLAYFVGKGMELSLGKRDTARLMARSRIRLNDTDLALLRRVEPLLVGELGGPKVLCSECSEPAVMPVEPRAWACATHAQ